MGQNIGEGQSKGDDSAAARIGTGGGVVGLRAEAGSYNLPVLSFLLYSNI